MSKERRKPYRAYLLRCWYEGEAAEGQAPLWRFSMEEVSDERRRLGFNHFEEIMAFLRAELITNPPTSELPESNDKGGEMTD